jgi:hypothetical protein
MIGDLRTSWNEVLTELSSRQLKASSDAMQPLQAINFKQLISIHDHEEYFLRRTFLSNLVAAHKDRVGPLDTQREVNKEDVDNAMRMMGEAIMKAAEQTFTKHSKTIIVAVCPYC